jgi:hypothetical protein
MDVAPNRKKFFASYFVLLLVTTAPAQAQRPTMPVTTWFSLSDTSSPLSRGKSLIMDLPKPDTDAITVYGHRANTPPEAWWPESKSGLAAYEATNSDAAQPLIPFAAWTTPEQQRLTSGIKSFLGVCGIAMLTCPDR